MALNGIHAKQNTDESIKEDHDMEMSRIMKCIHTLTEAHTHTAGLKFRLWSEQKML